MFTSIHTSEPRSDAQVKRPIFFQPKLRVNTPGDAYEQEADRVAEQVMRMREGDAPVVQRMQLAPVGGLQRKCAECEKEEKEKVQRKEGGGGDAGGHSAPSIVSDVLSSGGGKTMDGGTRQFMESRFGQDFGQVRIHTDGKAAESAAAIQARAYTSGRDVVFGAGEYRPESESGKQLLAHELVHVGQQGEGGNKIQRLKISPTKSFTKGKCGERSVYWNFESGIKAPKGGGYIIQKIDNLENINECPSKDVDFIPIKPTFTFWEAWWVAEGDTIQEKHKLGVVDYTDRSARPAQDGLNKSGIQVSLGEVRFFSKKITGDLGKEGVVSSDPVISKIWKPGMAPQSGWLPSTKSQPSWWSNSLDGPKYRWANSWWNCCGDKSKHKSESDANPK